jgi:hypothetical protein
VFEDMAYQTLRLGHVLFKQPSKLTIDFQF